jgi:hypothetical protein
VNNPVDFMLICVVASMETSASASARVVASCRRCGGLKRK